MTSFGSIFKVMGKDRFWMVNKIILVQLAVMAISLIWVSIRQGIQSGVIFGVMVAVSGPITLGAFILLANANEKIYKCDTYRLIPVSETKLYSTNLLSSALSILYFGIVQVALYCITMAMDRNFMIKILQTGSEFTTSKATEVILGSLLIIVMLFILGWTTISLVHLVVSATNNFLPNMSRRVINVVLYIVVIFLVIRVAVFIFKELGNLSGFMTLNNGITQYSVSLIGLLIVILLESVLNVFLLKKWVETTPNN